MNNIKEDETEINLTRLLRFYLKEWKCIAVTCAAAVLIAIICTMFFMTPMYKSSVTIYVNNMKNTQMDVLTGSNLSAAIHLVKTYVNIIKSKPVLEEVIRVGNLDCTVGQLRGMLSASQVDETEIFVVTAVHENPEQAAHIVNTVAKVAPRRIAEIVEGSSAKIVEFADPSSRPFTPNLKKNIILGAALGGMLVLFFLTMRYLFDMRVENEEDAASFFQLPLLGSIPAFSDGTRSTGYVLDGYGNYTGNTRGGDNK